MFAFQVPCLPCACVHADPLDGLWLATLPFEGQRVGFRSYLVSWASSAHFAISFLNLVAPQFVSLPVAALQLEGHPVFEDAASVNGGGVPGLRFYARRALRRSALDVLEAGLAFLAWLVDSGSERRSTHVC